MEERPDDPRRVEVWVAMAEHFLDTETRHAIPATALCCIRAGLSVAEARGVWRDEVSPAVGFNVWDVAGEWAGWDRDWLVARIRNVRARRSRIGAFVRGLLRRTGLHPLEGVWHSVEAFMRVLLDVADPLEREERARELTFLARHAFDFAVRELAALDAPARERMRALHPEPFRSAMAAALVSRKEAQEVERRIEAAVAPARIGPG
jgi:hypothetical protein